MENSNNKNVPNLILHTESSKYLAELIKDKFAKNQINYGDLKIERKEFPGGEKYYRFEETDQGVLNKTCIYICPLCDDNDILEVIRVGHSLVQLGFKKRIFVVPYMAYSTMEYANEFGEVVTCKITAKLLSSFSRNGNTNIFLFYDLHNPMILNYFEESTIRYELSGFELVLKHLDNIGFNKEEFMFASVDLGRTQFVNRLATEKNVPLAFMKRTNLGKSHTLTIAGSVKGKKVVIYDDLVRSGKTIIEVAEKYLAEGAEEVHCVVSHYVPNNDENIQQIIQSRIKTFAFINTHPKTQNKIFKDHSKFYILDAHEQIFETLRRLVNVR